MKLKLEIKIVTVLYIITSLLWVIFNAYTKFSGLYEGPIFQFVLQPFLVGMTLLPLIGGLIGIRTAISWGGLRSALGRGLFFLSLGTISWGLGMVAWNYYLFVLGTEIPYPSIADLFFTLIWVFWTYGMIQLSRATGAKFGLRSTGGKILSVIVPLAIIGVSYYLLFVVARGGEFDLGGGLIQTSLGFLYPIGDMVILTASTLVFLLSYQFLGGKYKNQILALFVCFALNYVADFIFVLTTSGDSATYYNGAFVDFLYTTIMYIASISVLLIDPRRLENDVHPNQHS
ncbi:MAG: hypothetical protein Q7S76_04075 [bacterium]|nr:hypothetical protein [bacterium]